MFFKQKYHHNLFFYFADNGETSFRKRGRGSFKWWQLKWWILGIEDEDEYELAPLTSARKTYKKFFAQDGETCEDNGSPSEDCKEAHRSGNYPQITKH